MKQTLLQASKTKGVKILFFERQSTKEINCAFRITIKPYGSFIFLFSIILCLKLFAFIYNDYDVF